MMRKKRVDRNHVIYQIVCVETGDNYIGVTVAQKGAFLRSVKIRWQKHRHRALMQGRDWALCEAIRSTPADAWAFEVVEVVRGKAAAHTRERELIALHGPTLNTA